MANKPAENLIYDFLVEQIAAFPPTDFEIHPTPYDKRIKNTGIEIGDADTSMLPNGNGDEMTEYDGLLTIEIYARVTGLDKTQRTTPRQAVFDIKTKLLQLLEDFPTLNNRGCKIRALRQVRFFDDTRSDKWAIERVPVVLNPRNFRAGE